MPVLVLASLGCMVAGCTPQQQQIEALTAERDNLTKKLAELVATLSLQQQQEQEAKAQKADVERHWHETQSALEAGRHEVDELRQALNRERRRALVAEGDLRALEDRAHALDDALKSIQRQHDRVTEENGRLYAHLSTTTRSLAEAQANLRAWRAANPLSDAQQALLADNENLKQRVNELEQRLKSAPPPARRTDLAHLKARVVKLSRDYRALLGEPRGGAGRGAARETTRQAFEEAQTELAKVTGAQGVYAVQYGDHLSSIAQAVYGDSNRWRDIFQANAFLIGSPDRIYAGMILVLPR